MVCCIAGTTHVRLAGLQLLVQHAHVSTHGLAEVLDQLLQPPQWQKLHCSEQVNPPLLLPRPTNTHGIFSATYM